MVRRDMTHGWRLALLVPVGLLAGGVTTGLASTAAAGAARSAKTKDTVVTVAKRGKFGSVLVTTKGMTLYTYGKDTRDHSTVTGSVLAAWPALVVPAGRTPVGKGVTGIGEFRRQGGEEQVTYHGSPLYTFVGDKKAGDVTGQGINHFAVVRLGSSAAATKSITSAGTTTTAAGNGIPQNNGGDGDSDNNGSPSDGDGNL